MVVKAYMNAVYPVGKFALGFGIFRAKLSVLLLVITLVHISHAVAVVIVIAVIRNVSVALLAGLAAS